MSSDELSADPIELVVDESQAGARLDWFLAQQFSAYSRVLLRKVINAAGVTVDGKRVKAAHHLRAGERVSIVMPALEREGPQPENIPLDVLYEDEVLAVINKPPNMVVHPARGNWTSTLVNALAFRFQNQLSTANGNYRLGIVHRLDRDTSGAILIAKDDKAHSKLSMQFEKRTVFKEYVALVVGELDRDSDYVEVSLKQHPHEREKQAVAAADDPDGKPACSYYEVLERFRGYTLVKVQPRTGRTHQIRVHLAHVGCPVLADKLYGRTAHFRKVDLVPGIPREGDTDTVYLNRQALHAFRLRFKHPVKETWLEIEAPLPADMSSALEALREFRPLRA